MEGNCHRLISCMRGWSASQRIRGPSALLHHDQISPPGVAARLCVVPHSQSGCESGREKPEGQSSTHSHCDVSCIQECAAWIPRLAKRLCTTWNHSSTLPCSQACKEVPTTTLLLVKYHQTQPRALGDIWGCTFTLCSLRFSQFCSSCGPIPIPPDLHARGN